MFLTKEEEKMADGEYGETIRKSMDILIALGDIYGAEKFVDIKSAQVSGVSYKTIGEAGLVMKTEQSAIKVESQQYPLH